MATITHIDFIRQQLPATTSHVFLNTGSFGPIPACAVQAMHERMQFEHQHGRLGKEAFDEIQEISQQARGHLAHLLNADPAEITLTDNTGEGLNIVYYGLPWQAGDEVIITNHEHFSALAPLYQLHTRYGVVTRTADIGTKADTSLVAAVQPLITPRTRLISLSHVTWTTGTILDIQSLVQLAHHHHIPVLVDGAQAAGNILLDMQSLEADFYAIPMQKWLCGPDGTGALYIRATSQHLLAPTYVGYNSAQHEAVTDWELYETAQRFELGGRQTAAILGQCAALAWLEQTVGYPWLFQRIADLSRYAYAALATIPGLTLYTPQPGTNGLLSFTLAQHDDLAVVQYLQKEHNIYVRNIPDNHVIRISTGFYNTTEEIDALAHALKAL